MVLLNNLLVGLIALATVGLDIVGFFLVVRLAKAFRPARFLVALDRIGAPAIDPLIEATGRTLGFAPSRLGPDRTRFVAAMALLVIALCRLGLGAMLL